MINKKIIATGDFRGYFIYEPSPDLVEIFSIDIKNENKENVQYEHEN